MKTLALIVLLAAAPTALADWTAHADFTSCPRKYFPNPTAEEGPFATEAACEAKVAEAKRGNNASCARYSCKEGAAGSSSSSAAAGHQLDSTIERAISAGVSGDISGGDAASLVALGMLGNALLAGSSPEQQQQAEARRQLRQQQEAEEARQRAAAEEERKNRLLGEMQGIEQTDDLQLMSDDGVEQVSSGAVTGGELALMTGDDDTQNFMGKRKAPAPKRNQPPATRVSQGPYTTPASGSAPARGSPGNGTNGQPPPEPVNPPGPTDRESVAQGMEDGDACRQRSPGMHCRVLRGEALGRCQRSYNNGYDAGEANQQRRLTAQGAAAGAADKNANRSNAPFSHAEARGPCGNIFVQAYNQAYR